MMLFAGIELVKFARDVRRSWDLLPMAATVAVAVISNMARGFVAGLAVHYGLRLVRVERGTPTSKTAQNGQ
jgi:MFS superfamily sulfate permease-like transporter